MKQILCSALLFIGLSVTIAACSSGDYVANSSSPANNSVNPLNPLTTSQFTWPALGNFSASVNGATWVADTAFYLLDTTGANLVYAYKNNYTEVFVLYLLNTWQGSLYNMGHLQYNTSGSYGIVDTSGGKINVSAYASTLGNSGELYMQQNDTAIFQGRFYFQAVSSTGQIINVSNGYFNLHK